MGIGMPFLLCFLIGAPLMAAPSETNSGASRSASSTAARKKTTEVSFEDVLVQGKYHFSDEAVTTVEQDKVLDALLGVRTDFQDRIDQSTEQR
jgi:hypothetical protein